VSFPALLRLAHESAGLREVRERVLHGVVAEVLALLHGAGEHLLHRREGVASGVVDGQVVHPHVEEAVQLLLVLSRGADAVHDGLTLDGERESLNGGVKGVAAHLRRHQHQLVHSVSPW
jgi:hypothetical protein